MEYIPIVPMDSFIVVNKTILSDKERKILTRLYQPIIGINAISLYLTLWDCLDKQEIISDNLTHHYLVNQMMINLTAIKEARSKLEAIGLLKTYIKEDKINNYIYELYSPASVYDFLNDPILSTLLCGAIGNKEYKNIIDYYKTPKLEKNEYKEITSSFQDVYKIGDIIDTNKVDEVKNTKRLNLKIDAVIDTDNIISSIPKEMLDYRKITKNIKELIIKLGLVYNFNESEMLEIVNNSIKDRCIDILLLQNNSRKYYKFNNSNRLPSLVYKNETETKDKVTSASKKDKIIHTFETTSPYDYLRAKNKCRPTNTELDLLKYLLVDMDLKPGVVNVLLDYVLRINNNKLTKKYIETIAAQWKKSNIETVVDAMELAALEYNGKNKIKKETKKEVPKWMDNDIISTKATDEEQEEIKKWLNSLG